MKNILFITLILILIAPVANAKAVFENGEIKFVYQNGTYYGTSSDTVGTTVTKINDNIIIHKPISTPEYLVPKFQSYSVMSGRDIYEQTRRENPSTFKY